MPANRLQIGHACEKPNGFGKNRPTLHTFKPSEIKDLVPDYIAACHEKGIFQVRIIHGKGIGNLRRTVHSILSRHPLV